MSGVSKIRNIMKKTLMAVAISVVLGLLIIGTGAFLIHGQVRKRALSLCLFRDFAWMKGIAKTVIPGTKIDTFDIEVLAILKGGAATGDFIFVRASGEP